MSGKLLDDLGQLQRAVIEVVWELGEASVHQVRDRLRQRKELAYTTVLTAMQKLEKAGWLRHRTEGKVYIYSPGLTKEDLNRMGAIKVYDLAGTIDELLPRHSKVAVIPDGPYVVGLVGSQSSRPDPPTE